MKRKRTIRTFSAANPDGNYTPSDSDSDSDDDYPIERKIIRIQSNNESDNESTATQSTASNSTPANSQLLHAALRKIQELENELAELDEADYDSGHHDEDDVDEGNASDFEERAIVQDHDHRNEIVNEDAEALGFAFCVKETFDYLAAEGVTDDNPIVKALRERFLDRCDPVSLN